jgi:hypothetical protein
VDLHAPGLQPNLRRAVAVNADPLAVEVANRDRQYRALELLREWWRLHLLSQSGASTYGDYLRYVDVLRQVRELLDCDDNVSRMKRQATEAQTGVEPEDEPEHSDS